MKISPADLPATFQNPRVEGLKHDLERCAAISASPAFDTEMIVLKLEARAARNFRAL
ncbi:hypothetical protein [Mesorhizobium sp. WSM4904]|uniref:hypothetical protein n=1 Tax=Mesorhizobium sp. WSM4904 TaxID=3038545 RepID=UPI0024186130|nr:hypothetical protein [Mesorhizobium sp. WSM4904]WFP63308.1 hypothetical protein QAZ47_01615 [Mesorhizobium sp. WSM4904]